MLISYAILALLAFTMDNVSGLSKVHPYQAEFQFPDGSVPNASPDTRQTITVNGSITSGVLTGLPPLPIVAVPTITATTSLGIVAANGSCICVPTGRCTSNNTIGLPTDGSGQIDIRIVTNLLAPPTPGITPAIVTPSACQAGILDRCCSSSGFLCGVRYPAVSTARLPTAGQAYYGAHPWQAVLLGPGDIYAGSGALIDNYHILTAAHRVRDYATTGRALKVRLGEWDASTDSEPIRTQEFIVARMFIHPSFNPVNLKNDVALLRLSTPVILGQTPTITPACLPYTSFTGSRCYVAGWGKNDFSNSGTYQAIQKEVDVPVKASTECQSSLSATRLGASFVFDAVSFVCAGGESGKDACTGDGGSPLMCELSGRWYVVGLVAWGIGCATGGVPGVYVNVASYVSWIQATVLS